MTEHDDPVRDLLQRAIRAGTAPAVAAQWGRAGTKTFREALGAASVIPERVEVSGETWFDLASLTKPLVTTTLTLLAFRNGAIRPSTQVGEVLKEIRGSDVGSLEVDRLLSHTSGLPAWLPLYCLTEGDPKLLPKRLGEVELGARPGQRVEYSCVGFVILGLMLSRAADLSLDSLFRSQVSSVLGLEEDLAFCPDPATHSLIGVSRRSDVETVLVAEMNHDRRWIPPIAQGQPDDGNARLLGGVAGNAGLFGTLRGVATLASEYLHGGGRLLSAEEAQQATTPHTPGLEQARGWGWQLASTRGCSAGEALSEESFGHTGFAGVSVWCEPATRSVFVLLTNRNHPSQRENDLHPLRRRFHALASQSLEH
jgi:CubicO group peptidase (beta-lactamase class C family)